MFVPFSVGCENDRPTVIRNPTGDVTTEGDVIVIFDDESGEQMPDEYYETESQLRITEHSVVLFRHNYKRFPKSIRELNKYVPKMYGEDKPFPTKDSWGREVRFDIHDDDTYIVIRSAGIDGQFDTKDDITSDYRHD